MRYRPELAAARVLLDEKHVAPHTDNDYIYHVGRMGEHNVAITRPTSAGRSAASEAATTLVHAFPKIRFVLMVGVGGGATDAPSRAGSLKPTEDIFLGDVVVGIPHGNEGEWFPKVYGLQIGAAGLRCRLMSRTRLVSRGSIAV